MDGLMEARMDSMVGRNDGWITGWIAGRMDG